MSAAVSSSPANQDRPLLMRSPLPSDQRGGRMRTLLDLLTIEKTDGLDRTMIRSNGGGGSRWRVLRERLGLKAIGCCGVATWREGSSDQPPVDDDVVVVEVGPTVTRQQEVDDGVGPTSSGMNLAAALAAERQYRAAGESEGAGGDAASTPSRVSLMRLLEETSTTDGCDLEREREEVWGVGSDSMCCVCMGRKKGAALIPCGHTYCRVCSREVWVNRGSCPLCNRHILEILDIF